MNIRRLGWAGAELTSNDTKLVIDLIESFGVMDQLLTGGPEPLPIPSSPVDFALVTHLHVDHTDPRAIAAALTQEGRVLRPRPGRASELDPDAYAAALADAEEGLQKQDLASDALDPWETRTLGPFKITALPAVDGFGDPQLSWLVEADGQSVFHAGDTTFHGSWWNIAARCSPIDVAFVPINGVVCDFPHRQPPSPLPAAMDPRQAAVACRILGARVAVPMHYGAVHVPPFYVQVDEPAEDFERECAQLGVATAVLAPGETLQAEVLGGVE